MMLKKIALAVALSAASTVSLAGTFDGFFGQAGIGMADTALRINIAGDPGFSVKLGDDSFIGQVALGYSYAWGKWNLAGSAFYDIGDQKAGMISGSSSDLGSASIDFKGKNVWGISIDPGMYVNDTTLLYVKLGYTDAKFEANGQQIGGTKTFDAFTYGIGVKYSFAPHWYGTIELQQTAYQGKSETTDGSTADFKPETRTGLFSIGYTF